MLMFRQPPDLINSNSITMCIDAFRIDVGEKRVCPKFYQRSGGSSIPTGGYKWLLKSIYKFNHFFPCCFIRQLSNSGFHVIRSMSRISGSRYYACHRVVSDYIFQKKGTPAKDIQFCSPQWQQFTMDLFKNVSHAERTID